MRLKLLLLRVGWLLVLPLVAACPEDDDDDSSLPGDDDMSSPTPLVTPKISLGEVEHSNDEPGVIDIPYTLVGYAGLTLDLNATYSLDGLNFNQVTTSDDAPLEHVEATPEGAEYTLSWTTLADLGFLDGQVWFRLTAQGDGYELGPETVQIDVSNLKYDKPCLVTVDPPPHSDGQIPITYHLMDLAGDTCNISIRVKLTVSEVDEDATPNASDPGDALDDVFVPPEGITRRFVWDSLTDIGPLDQDVTIIVTAADQNNEESDTVSFTVYNDPLPDPGDVIFTELMFRAEYGFPYLELFNTTLHPIELSNLFLWSGSMESNFDGNLASIRVSPDQSLQIAPQSYLVLSQVLTDQNQEWVDTLISFYSMSRRVDSVELWRGDIIEPTVIDSVYYNIDDESANLEIGDGHAIALMPDFMSIGANDALSAWCVEDAPIAGYPDGAADFGSPGESTTCTKTVTPTPPPAATPTPTPATPTPPPAATPTPSPTATPSPSD